MLRLVGRRNLLTARPSTRYYSTVDAEPPRRSNKWLIIGTTALLGVVGYRYIEAQRRETERANADLGKDARVRYVEAKQKASDLYEESKQKVDTDRREVSAAKDSFLETTRAETANVSNSVKGAATHITDEADTLMSQAKKVVNDETDWIKKEYEHAKGVLRDEKQELQKEADRFRAEHHLKEGTTPTDEVVARSRGERSELAEDVKATYYDAKGRVLSEKERLEREAKGNYDSAKQEASGFWSGLKGKAEDKKAEAEQQAQDAYNKTASEKERLKRQAQGTVDDAKQEASGLWNGLKGKAQETKAEAEKHVQLGSIVNAAKEKLEYTINARDDGRRPAAAVVAEERPIVV